jgi:hypothetical protein
MADELNEGMVTQRNLQIEQQSPTLQRLDADQQEQITIKREDAAGKMQQSDWWNNTPEQSISADAAGIEKDVTLTTSDDHLPYLADIQPEYDLVGQYSDDQANGTPRQPGEYAQKYIEPTKRTVQGIDLANGTRHWNTADFNVEGVEHHSKRGVELLRESTNSAIDGPNEDGIRGTAQIAHSVILEGGDFNKYKRATEALNISDDALKLGWNAAARAQAQQSAFEGITADVGEADVAELPPEPTRDINSEDLVNEAPWMESAQFLWDIENSAEFAGSPEELNEWALNEMSNFNWRIVGAPGINGTSMAYYAAQAAVQGQDYADNLLTLIQTYDRVNTDWGVVGRSLGAVASDPTTIAGLGFGRIGAQLAARVAKNRLQKFLAQAGTIGAGEGAMFAGGENLARQSVAVDAGAQKEISGTKVATNAAVGGAVGAVAGPIVGGALSPYAMKMYRKGGQRMLANARNNGGRSQLSSQTGAIGDLAGFIPLKKNTTDHPEVEDAASLDSAIDLADSERFPNNRALKVALQDRVKAAAKTAGIDLESKTPETIKFLKQLLVKDAKRALRENKNAVGWYDRTVSEALDVLSLIHPEIKTDPKAKFAFTYALAVTSNGLKVDKNFELAELAYETYKATGKMPTDIGIGTAGGAINKSLGEFNDWAKDLGAENLSKIMESNFTVRQLKRAGFNVTGEHQDTTVRGAAILGPKIGNGFFSNLNGRFDQLTMDRWLMRTWGRMTGSLITPRPDMVRAKTTALKEIQAVLKADKDIVKAWKEIGVNLNERSTKKLATQIAKSSMLPANRKVMNESGAEITRPKGNKGKTETATPGSFARRVGNGLTKDIDGQKEAPTVADRNRIRSVFGPALEELKADGAGDMTMADLQALVWYPEKRLYDKAKSATDVAEGYADDEAPDYANAAKLLASGKGFTDKQINDEVTRGRTARARPASGSGAAQAQQGPGEGLASRERSDFLRENLYAKGRAKAVGDGGVQLYSGGGGSSTKGLRGVEEVFTPKKPYANLAADSEIPAPVIYEMTPNTENATQYADALQASKDASKFGASVTVYSPEDYAGMRLFQTPDGGSGFAVKPDGDIVSVYSSGGGNVFGMLQLAVEQGGTHLDAVDTVLPKIYEMAGFKETKRLPWDDQYAPADWDKSVFDRYNKGEPDIVEMEYQK